MNTCLGVPCTKCKSWDYYRDFPFYKDFCGDIDCDSIDTTEVEIVSFTDFMQALLSPLIDRERKNYLISAFPEYVEKIENGK